MTTQHTPGPWRLNAGNEIEVMGQNRPLARALCGGMTKFKLTDAEANARLIAAAPELLEALEDLCSFETALTQEKWDKARDAIAKARGQ